MNKIKKWLYGDRINIEEITGTLQKVAENQAGVSGELWALKDETQKLVEAQLASETKLARFDEILRKVAESHQMLVDLARNQEERIDGHDESHKEIIEKLNALIGAQVAFESRVQRLEESLVRLGELAGKREDANDDRLVIDFESRNGEVDLIKENLDQVAVLPAENSKKVKAVVAAQAPEVSKRKTTAAKKPRKTTKKSEATV
jgi:hypothetical protein